MSSRHSRWPRPRPPSPSSAWPHEYTAKCINIRWGFLVGPSRRRTEGHDRWDGDHPSIIAADNLPAALVHHPVVSVAKQSEVGRFIGSAMDPVLDVVSGRPARRPLATRPRAAPIPYVEHLARRSLDH